MNKADLRILATRCHTDSCCPAIMESSDGEEVVIVGGATGALLASSSVRARVGTGEAAVVIPKSLFLEACNLMLSGNIENSPNS